MRTRLQIGPEGAFLFLLGPFHLPLAVARTPFLRNDLLDGTGQHLGQERRGDPGVARAALLAPSLGIGLSGDGEEYDAAARLGDGSVTMVPDHAAGMGWPSGCLTGGGPVGGSASSAAPGDAGRNAVPDQEFGDLRIDREKNGAAARI